MNETYNGVEFCDLSAFDKEKVNQGILEADEVDSEADEGNGESHE